MQDKQFASGFYPKPKHERAPDFVIGKLSIKREQAIEWLTSQTGEWVNLDLKIGKTGKGYAEVDTWQPNQQSSNTQNTSQNAISGQPQIANGGYDEFPPPPVAEVPAPPLGMDEIKLEDIPF